MSETIRYARLGKEDVNFGTGSFEVRLADGRVVTLQQVDLGELLSDASITTRDVTLDTLTVTTLTVGGVITPTGTLRLPEKADPGSPLSGEVWINSGGLVPEYADDAASPASHALVAADTTQTITNKTLTSPAITTPVLTGTATGTYALGGTPSLAVALDAASQDVTSLDEVHFADAAANPTASGRLRRNSADLLWHDGTSAKIVVLRDAFQTLTNKTLTAPVIATIVNTGTITLPTATCTLVGKDTTDTLTNKTFDAQGTGNSLTNVNTSALKTSTGSASGNLGSDAVITLNDYAFFPAIQITNVATGPGDIVAQSVVDQGTTVGRFRLISTGDGGDTYVVRWRYVTASDDPTICLVKDLLTGEIRGVWASDDPLPNNEYGLMVDGCESLIVKAIDLEYLSVLSAKASEAADWIRDRNMKIQNQAYRALQLIANDPAPSKWILENCVIDKGRLGVK